MRSCLFVNCLCFHALIQVQKPSDSFDGLQVGKEEVGQALVPLPALDGLKRPSLTTQFHRTRAPRLQGAQHEPSSRHLPSPATSG